MRPLLFALNAAPHVAESLCRQGGLDRGALEQRRFPDGEAYVRLLDSPRDRQVVLLCSLDRPDEHILPLLFAADAALQQGALGVGLVAPYLAYMRQDTAFQPGEAVTSATFARLLSDRVDWLVTVDPHLHRYAALDAIYSVPAIAASAAGPVARWIRAHVERPLIVGPDVESRQWVDRIAALVEAPSAVLRKTRRGDYDVSIQGDAGPADEGRTPVIVDDIASSARTMIEAVRGVRAAGHPPPVCVAVHALFVGDAFARLIESGPAELVTTNTVAHATNGIDVSAQLAAAVGERLAAAAER